MHDIHMGMRLLFRLSYKLLSINCANKSLKHLRIVVILTNIYSCQFTIIIETFDMLT